MASWAALVNVPKEIWSWAKRFIDIGAREELVRCREELSELRKRNDELEKLLSFQGTLVRRGNFLWSVKQGSEDDGPYCTHCWQNRQKAITLWKRGSSSWLCPGCDKWVSDPDRPTRQIRNPFRGYGV